MASALAPIIVVLMILFGGFYINVDSLPAALAWLQYLSIMRWAFMGLAVNEFTGTTFSCGDVADGDGCTSTGEEVGGRRGVRCSRVPLRFESFSNLYAVYGYNPLPPCPSGHIGVGLGAAKSELWERNHVRSVPRAAGAHGGLQRARVHCAARQQAQVPGL